MYFFHFSHDIIPLHIIFFKIGIFLCEYWTRTKTKKIFNQMKKIKKLTHFNSLFCYEEVVLTRNVVMHDHYKMQDTSDTMSLSFDFTINEWCCSFGGQSFCEHGLYWIFFEKTIRFIWGFHKSFWQKKQAIALMMVEKPSFLVLFISFHFMSTKFWNFHIAFSCNLFFNNSSFGR
jgi:hypothetical protein